jgi:hypothetical protein
MCACPPAVAKNCLTFIRWEARPASPAGQINYYLSMHLLIPMLGTLIWVGGSTVGIVLVVLIIVLLVR